MFDAATIARLAGHWTQVVDALVADPDQPLEQVPLLTAAERDELLVQRNATATAYPPTSLARLIEAQVARTPAATAVVGADATLSYAALDARANQLAHQLQQVGVGPNVPVAVCLARSAALLVGLLGILKAGGAFVPLDPSFPDERLRLLVADSGARLVLSDAGTAPRLAAGGPVVVVDAHDAGAAYPATPPPGGAGAEDLCYIIYTSGSTGRPKGVLVSQRALVNYLVWSLPVYTVAAGCGAPVQSTLAADAIFPSVFAPLLVGGQVVMVPESPALEALAQVLRTAGGFSLMKITPSQLEVLTHQVRGDDPQGWVHTLVIGAEALRGDVAAWWQAHAPQTHVINEYGPTETVVGCSIYRLPPGQPISGAVPIGLPIANLEFYVLDEAGQPLPIGVPGELYIGGDGLAWGYLHQPALTAAAFVPHPFSARPGARLYKTGDVVRYLAPRAANLEFLGRRDHQVKVRGYRVELGEIEAGLAAHPAVREVAVVVRTEAGDPALVAYVVPHDPAAPPPDWRAYLQARLPAYMVPTAVVPLAAFPLLPNGKLDRQALPAPSRPAAPAPLDAPPRTPLEQTLAAIWAAVLHLDSVALHDNFFELGGDSILSVRIVARARAYGLALRPGDLFEHQTIAELAQVVSCVEPPKGTPVPEVDGPTVAPLGPVQAWFFAQGMTAPNHWNQALLLECQAPVDFAIMQRALASVQHHHAALRLQFAAGVDGRRWQCVAPDPGAPSVSQHDLAACAPGECAERIAHDRGRVAGNLQISRRVRSGAQHSLKCRTSSSHTSCWPPIIWSSTSCRGMSCSTIWRPRTAARARRSRAPAGGRDTVHAMDDSTRRPRDIAGNARGSDVLAFRAGARQSLGVDAPARTACRRRHESGAGRSHRGDGVRRCRNRRTAA